MEFRKTLSGLRTAVRRNLDEPTAAFWSNAQLNAFLNEAKDRVWTECRKLKSDFHLINRASTDGTVYILDQSYATSSFQIVAGTREYTLPPDLAELKLIECITSGYETIVFSLARDLTDEDFRALRQVTDQQTPTTFLADIIGERTLTIAPKSNTTLDLRLWYVPILDDLGATHSISGITRSSTTATATTNAAHGLTTGDSVTVAGADQTSYNVTATITVTSTTTFTYSVSGSPTTPATGTITYTTDADRLEMPHPLYKAVEAYATAEALAMDRDYTTAAIWESKGQRTIADFFGAHARQTQEPEFVRGVFE